MSTIAENEKVYYGEFVHQLGAVRIAATERGIVQVGLPSESGEKFWVWLKQRFPKAAFEKNESRTQTVFDQLHEYFEGRRQAFSLELDLRGTEFQKTVWKAILKIPYGRTITYGELAKDVGSPEAARAAGAATGANPIGIIVPCHRVVGANGSLTGYGGGLPMKEFLLNLEQGHNGFSFLALTRSHHLR